MAKTIDVGFTEKDVIAAFVQDVPMDHAGLAQKDRPPEPEPKVEVDRESTPATPPLPKEEPRHKRGKTQDFETLFLRDQPVTARLGMSAYIRTKYHKRITKIISVIGGNSLTISSYIDNVLEQHFAAYQDEIDELYNKNVKGVFDDEI